MAVVSSTFKNKYTPIPAVNLGNEKKEKKMNFLKSLIEKTAVAVETNNLLVEIAKWKEMFLSFFGSSVAEDFPKGDEAMYKLLALGQQHIVIGKMVESPAAFCRGNVLSAIFLGKSQEWVPSSVDPDKKERKEYKFSVASQEELSIAAEAVSPLLFGKLQEIADSVGKVSRWFWVTNPSQTGYDPDLSGGRSAQEASTLMHCILNVIEGVSPDLKGEVGNLFVNKMFGQLPPGVYSRIAVPKSGNNLVSNNKVVARQAEEGEKSPKSKRSKTAGKKVVGESVPPPPTPAQQLAAAAASLKIGSVNVPSVESSTASQTATA